MGICGSEKIVILFAGGICGVSPKAGSLLAGVYMILMTNMYLIFEEGHLNRTQTLLKQYQIKHYSTESMWIVPYYYYTAIALAIITYPICFYFLYSIQWRNTVGLFIYIVWIFFYDLANIVLVVLTANSLPFSISDLEWFGLATRIPTDCFWLLFIITYFLMIIEGRSTGRMSLKTRRISRRVSEPPRFRLGINARRVQ